MQNGEAAIGISKLTELVAKWRGRCKTLAGEGNFWEAGRLSEAANELTAAINDPLNRSGQAVTTDKQVADLYERALRQQPSVLQPNFPGQHQPLYQPGPGMYPATRVVD